MTKRKTNDLTRREDFINEMIKDAIEHTKGFDVALISDGKYMFLDYTTFLEEKGLVQEFIDFVKKIYETTLVISDDFEIVPPTKESGEKFIQHMNKLVERIHNIISEDDLPFAEEFKNEK
jgi:coenzyme F420-reducing hydrogenase delta subunit